MQRLDCQIWYYPGKMKIMKPPSCKYCLGYLGENFFQHGSMAHAVESLAENQVNKVDRRRQQESPAIADKPARLGVM